MNNTEKQQLKICADIRLKILKENADLAENVVLYNSANFFESKMINEGVIFDATDNLNDYATRYREAWHMVRKELYKKYPPLLAFETPDKNQIINREVPEYQKSLNKPFLVIDNFVSDPDTVRNYSLITGFGTWHPKATDIGYINYDGVNINGHHSMLIRALTRALGHAVYPQSMMFRVTGKDSDPSRVHSDRPMGVDWTCIVYLNKENENSGTGFYQHKLTGAIEQPPLEVMMQDAQSFELLKKDMDEASEDVWELKHFVEAKWNRAVVFHAPLYHSRIPKYGIGRTDEEKRMVWVCQFNV